MNPILVFLGVLGILGVVATFRHFFVVTTVRRWLDLENTKLRTDAATRTADVWQRKAVELMNRLDKAGLLTPDEVMARRGPSWEGE